MIDWLPHDGRSTLYALYDLSIRLSESTRTSAELHCTKRTVAYADDRKDQEGSLDFSAYLLSRTLQMLGRSHCKG